MTDAADVKVKPKDYRNLTYNQLLKIAEEQGIKGAMSLTKDQLIVELGGAPPGAVVYDRAQGYNYDEIKRMKDERQQIPGKTIFWEADEEAVFKIIGKNPWAFNNYDMTDPKSPIKFIFSRRGTCYCGEKVSMKEGEVRKKCTCGKWIMYIDPDGEVDAALT